jgi:hypothetical protein
LSFEANQNPGETGTRRKKSELEEEKMTASDPIFKPVTLPDFQNGNDTRQKSEHQWQLRRLDSRPNFPKLVSS